MIKSVSFPILMMGKGTLFVFLELKSCALLKAEIDNYEYLFIHLICAYQKWHHRFLKLFSHIQLY